MGYLTHQYVDPRMVSLRCVAFLTLRALRQRACLQAACPLTSAHTRPHTHARAHTRTRTHTLKSDANLLEQRRQWRGMCALQRHVVVVESGVASSDNGSRWMGWMM